MTAKPQQVPTKKLVCAIGGVLIFLLFCILPAPSALADAAETVNSHGETAMRILGITLFAIFWWVGEIVPDWEVSLLMLILWVTVGGISFSAAFAAFGSTSVWLIIGAFCLTAGVSKAGLFQRISWFLLRLFSPTFQGQTLALLLVGTACGPLIPSATAKAVLGATIAKSLADTMGYAPESRGRKGLFAASFIGFACTNVAFMSGSIFTYTLAGTLSDEVLQGLSWISWLASALPWLLISVAGTYLCIQVFFAPKETASLSKEYIQQRYDSLGRPSRKEKASSILLAAAVLFWILESYLHISAAVTALAAACLCFGIGLLKKDELSAAVPWGLVVFLGGVLNLGAIFSVAGIDIWMQSLLEPLFANLSTPLSMILFVAVMTLLLRLILVSQAATVIIMMAILEPAALAAQINPFVIGFVILSMQQCWFLSYQSTTFIPALSCMQGTVSHRSSVSSCVIFELLSLTGCIVSIPFWRMLGLIA